MALERRSVSLCERTVFANARLTAQPAAIRVRPDAEDATVNGSHVDAVQDDRVDGLKVFCGEGSTGGRGHLDIEIDYVAAL
jgi:hypothetical protein